ncbi:MAG: hypothetical protein KAR16_01970 [Bacteroidales bacterium]|nr:hypothetical protein [Bacteroidales bacterium]
MEVEYRTLNGADNQMVLVGDRVDQFRIGEHFFRNLKGRSPPGAKIFPFTGPG